MTQDNASPLDAASSRLSAAFARLETTLNHRSQNASAIDRQTIEAEINQHWEEHCTHLETNLKALQDECTRLQEENSTLSNQLQETQQSYVKMKTRNHEAAKRLDEQIEQLELIVEA